jgi:divalent metal cation (Fe/Co/Zn/Cd) transporter
MKEKIAGVSVVVSLLLTLGKLIVGFLTGCASVIAEGVHSGIDVLSSVICVPIEKLFLINL